MEASGMRAALRVEPTGDEPLHGAPDGVRRAGLQDHAFYMSNEYLRLPDCPRQTNSLYERKDNMQTPAKLTMGH